MSEAGDVNGMSKVSSRPCRAEFKHHFAVQTRWADNDAYGHVNNVVYYEYFDTAVNQHLIAAGVLDIANSSVIGLVKETRCEYFASLSFPDIVTAGLRVSHLGNSSVRYEIALFRNDAEEAAAYGHFVHVYVDRVSGAPVPIPDAVRAVIAPLQR